MVVGAEACHQSIPILDVPYRCSIAKASDFQKIEEIVGVETPRSPVFRQIRASDAVSVEISGSHMDLRTPDATSDNALESVNLQFVPSIRSGSFADIGHRRAMEDEHIRINDLSACLGPPFRFPTHSAFFGVFDGHGGPDAAAFIKENAIRLFFENADFPQAFHAGDVLLGELDVLLEELENYVRRAFLLADLALADDGTINSSCGTTALTALILGRLLLVANAGDCRAVLCRNGKAVDMSQDHKPMYAAERIRVEESGGYVEDVYLNGVLSVSRALGDWDMKLPRGSLSPLTAEPEFQQAVLTEADEFLIIGSDGIWDVMSSQHAVSVVRRGLRRHDDPEQCARDLVVEALRLHTLDNLTVIVVCFSDAMRRDSSELPRLRCCSLSEEALCSLRRLLEDGGR